MNTIEVADGRIQIREPRCAVCRNEELRVLANELLGWRGGPIILDGGKTHIVTYRDVWRDVNIVSRRTISYASLKAHSKRHYEPAGVARYWQRRLIRDFVAELKQKSGKYPEMKEHQCP